MKKRVINILKYLLIFLASLIIILNVYIAKNFSLVNFEQVLYGLINTKGSSPSGIIDGAIYTFIYGFLLFLIFVVIEKKLIKKHLLLCNSLIFLFSLIITCFNLEIFSYLFYNFKTSNIYEKYYVDPSSVTLTFPEEKRNLIYIFLESTEMTNVSKTNGGAFNKSYMPYLEKLALENTNFSNTNNLGGITQVYGTDYTIAGLVSQSSGISYKVKAKYKDNSFKNLTTIGDILQKEGYDNYFMLGSMASFASRDNYFEKHGNYQIFDYQEAIETSLLEDDYYVWWGFEDKKLYDYAKDKLTEISKLDKPFNFTMLTVDTHFTDGYLEESCQNNINNKYASVFLCEDEMLKDFLTWIMEQDFYKNTTIILAGDHLTMQSSFYKNISQNYKRVVYDVIINSQEEALNSKNRKFTSMDMFPTTLASLGVDIKGDRLALGTNLYSSKKTLLEIYGEKELNKQLRKKSNYYNEKILK